MLRYGSAATVDTSVLELRLQRFAQFAITHSHSLRFTQKTTKEIAHTAYLGFGSPKPFLYIGYIYD